MYFDYVVADDAHIILRGVDDAKERLISGIVTIRGTIIEKYNGKIREHKNVEYHIIFDYSKGNY
ncbi:MAG: hypothetical protein LBJ67_06290, partial [Planctomycetaceae bacterium]|nr:hypothetical protein [Planctomycetaceae bacterium]